MRCPERLDQMVKNPAEAENDTVNAIASGKNGRCDDPTSTSSLYNQRVRCWIGDNRRYTAPYGTVPGEKTQCTAAPEGGARTALRTWVRGCALILSLATSAAAQDVPSGQSVTLNEVLIDEVGAEAWLRFRFLAPQIAQGADAVTYAQAEPDFVALCDTVALPYLAEYDLTADVIVVSLMDREVPFGQADPEATQFFETFRLENGACVWQEF